MRPEWEISKVAAEKFNAEFAAAQKEYFAK